MSARELFKRRVDASENTHATVTASPGDAVTVRLSESLIDHVTASFSVAQAEVFRAAIDAAIAEAQRTAFEVGDVIYSQHVAAELPDGAVLDPGAGYAILAKERGVWWRANSSGEGTDRPPLPADLIALRGDS